MEKCNKIGQKNTFFLFFFLHYRKIDLHYKMIEIFFWKETILSYSLEKK